MHHTWSPLSSCAALEFSNGNTVVKRPGSTTVAPVAFSPVKNADLDIFSVELLDDGSNLNNFVTFGVSEVARGEPVLPVTYSDGVGRSRRTYGLAEQRESREGLGVYGGSFSCLNTWRKLRVGDILTAVLSEKNGTMVIRLNSGEFECTLDLPKGKKYCFAMTLANDHAFKIRDDITVTKN